MIKNEPYQFEHIYSRKSIICVQVYCSVGNIPAPYSLVSDFITFWVSVKLISHLYIHYEWRSEDRVGLISVTHS